MGRRDRPVTYAHEEVSKLEIAASYAAVVVAALLGVLIRLGLVWIGQFSTSQVFDLVWAQIVGCFIMGVVVAHKRIIEHVSVPLFAGLGTGLCGTITTFSSFMDQTFLVFANQSFSSSNRFSSFMNGLAITVVTISMSIAFLKLGMAVNLHGKDTKLPLVKRTVLHHWLIIIAASLLYVGAILLAALASPSWRGRVTFALVLAPPGALLRYYLAKLLNTRIAHFPLGTFAANMIACMIFAMTTALAKRQSVSFLTCSALKGLEDGFSGALSTISTFAFELDKLKPKDAFVYGTASWISGQVLFVLILGVPIWTGATSYPFCLTEPA